MNSRSQFLNNQIIKNPWGGGLKITKPPGPWGEKFIISKPLDPHGVGIRKSMGDPKH